MSLSAEEYEKEEPEETIKNNNHEHRNAITPGIISTQILRKNLKKLSIEQIEKYLKIIEQAFEKEAELIERKNNQVEQGNILIFKKKKRKNDIDC